MLSREKLPLVVGIVLPLLLILYVAVTAYLPSLFIKPKYNFIYSNDNYYDYSINVVNGKVNIQPNYRYDNSVVRQPALYLYDVVNDKSTLISLSQAQNYTLDPSNKSLDGFTVGSRVNDSYSYFPFFFSGNDRGIYLTGNGLNRVITERDYYYFKFVGWILNE
ncbi:MAG: hypothetical protein ACD_50C00152G0007 [uncultured bacterium]|nr:MAG: hypothetical protein ACD_50C00152G0007 [uncultured bacterium]OGH14887.1 MAG: hypothetical protein A2687_04545 [Candidatus Levybacteria bacterium RIFCSPHIGHO2_01_FULL_38_26]